MRSVSRPYALLLSLGFLVAVYLPFAATDWRGMAASNRRPHASANLNDQFGRFMGFRPLLNRGYISLNFNVLRVSRIRNVIRGQKGWLFYGNDESMRSYRKAQATTSDLESFVSELERRRTWLEERGIDYLVVIAPDKHTIYPEYMPSGSSRPPGPSKLDQVISYSRSHSRLDILDLRPVLLQAKTRYPVFYKTDTHWNTAGAYNAYVAIMDRVQARHPGIRTPTWTELTKVATTYPGDLSTMLTGVKEPTEETVEVSPRTGWSWRADTTRQGVSPVEDAAWTPDPAPPTLNPSAPLGKLVVFHDSFYFAGLYPFVAQDFKSTMPIWTHGFDYELVMREKPVLVIQESVERLVGSLGTNTDASGKPVLPPHAP